MINYNKFFSTVTVTKVLKMWTDMDDISVMNYLESHTHIVS